MNNILIKHVNDVSRYNDRINNRIWFILKFIVSFGPCLISISRAFWFVFCFDLYYITLYIYLCKKKNIGTLYFILFHYLSLSIPICETNNKISIVLSNQKSSYGQLTLNNYSNHIFSIIKWEQILKWMKLPSNCTNNAHH